MKAMNAIRYERYSLWTLFAIPILRLDFGPCILHFDILCKLKLITITSKSEYKYKYKITYISTGTGV